MNQQDVMDIVSFMQPGKLRLLAVLAVVDRDLFRLRPDSRCRGVVLMSKLVRGWHG